MRRIEYAVQKQTITNTINGEVYGDKYIEDDARQMILGLLSKYISFSDHKQAYWTDRYWYFDVEQYEKDVARFGVRLAKPVMEPVRFEKENRSMP